MNFIIAVLIRKTTTIVITEIINERKGAKMKKKTTWKLSFLSLCRCASMLSVIECFPFVLLSLLRLFLLTLCFCVHLQTRVQFSNSSSHIPRFHLDMLYLFFSKLFFFCSFPVCALCSTCIYELSVAFKYGFNEFHLHLPIASYCLHVHTFIWLNE